jgi:hypothetical protein
MYGNASFGNTQVFFSINYFVKSKTAWRPAKNFLAFHLMTTDDEPLEMDK